MFQNPRTLPKPKSQAQWSVVRRVNRGGRVRRASGGGAEGTASRGCLGRDVPARRPGISPDLCPLFSPSEGNTPKVLSWSETCSGVVARSRRQWRLGAAAGEMLGPGWVSASAQVPVVRPVLRGDRPLAFVDPAQVLWWQSKPRHSRLNSLSLSWGGERGAGDVGAGEVVAHGGVGSHHGDHRCRVRPRGTGAAV